MILPKGQRVKVRPQAYPMEQWPGVVVGGRGKFRRVRYDCHGVEYVENFYLLRLEGVFDADGRAIMEG